MRQWWTDLSQSGVAQGRVFVVLHFTGGFNCDVILFWQSSRRLILLFPCSSLSFFTFLSFKVLIFIRGYILWGSLPKKSYILALNLEHLKHCLCGIDTTELAILQCKYSHDASPLIFIDLLILLQSQIVLQGGNDASWPAISLDTPVINKNTMNKITVTRIETTRICTEYFQCHGWLSLRQSSCLGFPLPKTTTNSAADSYHVAKRSSITKGATITMVTMAMAILKTAVTTTMTTATLKTTHSTSQTWSKPNNIKGTSRRKLHRVFQCGLVPWGWHQLNPALLFVQKNDLM